MFFFAVSVFAETNFDEYVKAIKEQYTEKAGEVLLQSWKSGVENEYGYIVDHVTTDFEFVKGKVTEDGKVIISGLAITTGFCYTRDNQKMRVIQMVGMGVLITQDKVIEKAMRLTDYKKSILFGWDDNNKEVDV